MPVLHRCNYMMVENWSILGMHFHGIFLSAAAIALAPLRRAPRSG
jgi:hypothetical protein